MQKISKLKEYAYIVYSGYGPTTNHSLSEWLEAREILSKNRELLNKKEK